MTENEIKNDDQKSKFQIDFKSTDTYIFFLYIFFLFYVVFCFYYAAKALAR
jgi:hypothetical protein